MSEKLSPSDKKELTISEYMEKHAKENGYWGGDKPPLSKEMRERAGEHFAKLMKEARKRDFKEFARTYKDQY